MMKFLVLSMMIGCTALKFVDVGEQEDPDFHLQLEKNYAESIKSKARIDYFRGDAEACVFTGATWRATYTVEKSGLRKGDRAKANTCYRTERWWVDAGATTKKGDLRGQVEDDVSPVKGIEFRCVGAVLYTHFFKTDNCATADAYTGDLEKNEHSKTGLDANWAGCNTDLDKSGAALQYKGGANTELQALRLSVIATDDLLKTANTAAIATVQDSNNGAETKRTTGLAFTKSAATKVLVTADFKTLAAAWYDTAGSRKNAVNLIGLYRPVDKDYVIGDYVDATGVPEAVIDNRRKFNFKPPVCR